MIEKIKERAKDINKQCNAREVGNGKIFYDLAFKPNIYDLRGSPAVEIVKTMARSYPASVIAVEPNLKEPPDDLENVKLVGLEEASLAHL